MNDYAQSNKAAWEQAFDRRTEGYGEDVAQRLRHGARYGFLPPEVREYLKKKDLRGGQIAQLCCNNGRELMSAVLGSEAAEGVGFDIAENILGQARAIAAEADAPCRFVCCDARRVPVQYKGRFDLALILVGALCWFRHAADLLSQAAFLLREGGALVLMENHPFSDQFAVPDEDCFDPADPARLRYSYFKNTPFVDDFGMGYIDGGGRKSLPFMSFTHTLGETVTAACDAGLRIEQLREFDRDVCDNFPMLSGKGVPLSFLLTAQKKK